jgi:cyclomaltodextrinase
MRHEPRLRRFLNKLDEQRVLLKLQSGCDEIREGRLLTRDGRQFPLRRLGRVDAQEYFSAVVPAAGVTEYAFQVHACGADRWVGPDGAGSWFRYDPAEHVSFQTPAWVREAVFYQIFPERFCNGDPTNDPVGVEPWGSPPTYRNFMGGDLKGILDRLDYLAELGVTALYLTPIFKSGSNHKYDTIDYFTIDPHFGDMELFRKLVRSCHARGIRVILDAVFNHCSDRHPFFLDVRENGRRSRYWDWFFIKKWPLPERFARPKDALEWYECWWGFHSLPKLNFTNPEVEEYFLGVARYWLKEAEIDGWRLDVPNEIVHAFWVKFRRAVKEVNPEAYIVGEIWDDATAWLQGDQFDAVMNYRFQKALLAYFAEQSIDTRTLDHTLRQIMLDYPEQATAVMLNLLGSHDTARPMTVALNRAGGSPGFAMESLKLMATLQFSFEGAPCIYYGDEIGMEGGKDPDCRRCFPWDWQQRAESRQLRAYYQKLIAIRKANPALRTGTFEPLVVDNERELYAFERRAFGNHCIVALNRSRCAHTARLPRVVRGTELLADRQFSGEHLSVAGRGAVILRVES